MKKLLLIAALLLSALSAMAFDLQPAKNDKGKWGYVDPKGVAIIRYLYDEAYPFNGDYAKVCKRGKWGVINKAGREVIKIAYSEISDFADGVALVRLTEKKGYGYINEKMQFVVPAIFDQIGSFNSKGLTWAKKGSKYGLYRIDGTALLKPVYAGLGTFKQFVNTYDESDYKDCSVTYKSHWEYNGSHRFLSRAAIDDTNLSKLPEDAVGIFFDKYAGCFNGVMDSNGKILIEAGKYYRAFYPTEGIAPVMRASKNYFNYLDLSTGRLLLQKDAIDGWAFLDGVAVVKVKQGNTLREKLVKRDGSDATAKTYTNIFPRVNNVYITYDNDKYGMISANGTEILPTTAEHIMSTTGKYFPCSSNGLFGLVDNRGQWVVKPKYPRAGALEYGYTTVCHNEKWGCLDIDGREVLPCRWENFKVPCKSNQDIFWVATSKDENNPKYRAFSLKTNQFLFAETVADCSNFDQHHPGIAVVKKADNQFGALDTGGKYLIPAEFSEFSQVLEAYKMLQGRTDKTWRKIDSHRLRLTLEANSKSYSLYDTIDSENWIY